MQRLVVTSIPDDIYINNEELLSRLSLQRKKAALLKKNKKDFYNCCFSELLLKKALGGNAPKELEYVFNENNKPFLKGSNINFSLSHTNGFIAVAIDSASEIGVDIQVHRAYSEKIPCRFFHEYEVELLENCKAELREKLFFDLWAIKESFVKCTGKGISSGFRGFYAKQKDSGIFEILGHKYEKEYISSLYNINEALSLAVTASGTKIPPFAEIFDLNSLIF